MPELRLGPFGYGWSWGLIIVADDRAARLLQVEALDLGRLATLSRVPYYICPNCKDRSIDIDGFEGMSHAGGRLPPLRLRLPVRADGRLLPGAEHRARRLRPGRPDPRARARRLRADRLPRGELMGHDVVERLRARRLRGGAEPGRAGARVGRAAARRAARAAHEGGRRQARDRRPLPRLRRRRRTARRAQPAVPEAAHLRPARGSSSSKPARSSARIDGSLSGSVCARTSSTSGWASAHAVSADDRLGRVALPPRRGDDRVADRHGAAAAAARRSRSPRSPCPSSRRGRRSGSRSPASPCRR